MKSGTKARRHDGTMGKTEARRALTPSAPSPSVRASVPWCLRAFPRGFTLTEILIVIGIIVLLIALAVPALALISGSRSIDGAENNISAMLGRVRADAMGLEKEMGLFFFIDPATRRVTLAQVQNVSGSSSEPILLDLVPDRDFLALPKGVGAQVIDNVNFGTGTSRLDDAYIGFNTAVQSGGPNTAPTTEYGGIIMFDGSGRLVSKRYGFEATEPNGDSTAIFNLLWTGKIVPSAGDPVPPKNADLVPPSSAPAPHDDTRSAFGLILFDLEAFLNNGNHLDTQVSGTNITAYATEERGEESWLDQNSVPLMINRYNGTLIRGE